MCRPGLRRRAAILLLTHAPPFVAPPLRPLSAVNIQGIARLRHGANCSPEGLSRGLTHGFAMEFEGAAARDAYLPHPAHEAFKARHVPKLEEVLVVDF